MKVLLISSCALVLISTTSIVADPDFNPQHPASDPAPITGQHLSAGELPEGLSASDWSSIQAQITAGRYRAYAQTDGSFASANPAHGWNIMYAADGTTTLQPRDRQAPSYQLGLRLEAVGYTKPRKLHQPPQLSAEGTTVTYQWTEHLREWWTNSENGLEQWFELEQRPAGATENQTLQLQLTLAGDLSPRQAGDTLIFANAGGSEITYSKLIAWDATGRDLSARMQLTADGLTLEIEDQDARYPLTIDPILVQEAYLKASNTDGDDQFGVSLALDGDTLVVGAWREDSNATGVNGNQADDPAGVNSGAAYVFTRSGTVWSQQAYLKASNTGGSDSFGISVDVDADTVVVGARAEDSDATGVNGSDNNNAEDSGAAYVFFRNGTSWSQQAYLKASNTGQYDEFGNSVAVSGDIVVVGAPGEGSNATGVDGNQSDDSADGAGAAYVFTRNAGTWSQQAYLKASNTGQFDLFGSTVAIDGETVVVGADGEDSDATGVNGSDNNLAEDSGAAYVFNRSGTSWSQQAYLKASNTGAGDQFGWFVAISGDTLVVGAPEEASNATGVNGNQSDDSTPGTGAAYVFTRNAGTWSQQAYLKASNSQSNDAFGVAVAVDGDRLVVGANQEDSNATGVDGNQSDNTAAGSGAAYLFTRSATTWSQEAYLKASNPDPDDQFGRAVSLDGDTVVVGAYVEDSSAKGVDGDQADNSADRAGAVYVFAPPRRVMVISQ